MKVPSSAAKGESADEVEMGLAVMVVTGVVSVVSISVSCSPLEVSYLILVSGLLQRVALASHSQALGVVSLQTFVHMVIRFVWVWSVRGSVQRGTCAFVGPWSNIGLVVWIVMAPLHSLSEQLVLPELLVDSEE